MDHKFRWLLFESDSRGSHAEWDRFTMLLFVIEVVSRGSTEDLKRNITTRW
ncbi:hypothetical protein AN958_00021 [Leucoagaricus sp. SymC.cos]|nr:hypothetical protein AN958_00021 [Leucoagaricus sp. SymC.cos]